MWNKCFVVLVVLNSLLIAQTADAPTNPQTPSPKIWATDDVNNLPEFRRITTPIKPYLPKNQGGGQQILQPIPIPVEGNRFVRPKQIIERWKVSGAQTFHAPKENPYVKGELVIQFNEQGRAKLNVARSTDGMIMTGINAVDALNAKYGAHEMARVVKDEELPPKAKEFRLDLIYVLKVDESLDLEKVAKEYRSITEVKGCSPNYYGQKCNVAKTYPNDTYFDWAPNLTQGPEAWTISRGSSTDTIAILDIEQFNIAHPDLDNNYSGNGSNESGYPFNGTGSWHGTGCAGHACAEINNAAGISGSAGGWGATRGILWLPYRFGTLAGNIAGITYAITNGASVISQSIAFSGNTAGLEDAFATALANNVLSFAAAGNENNYDLTYYAPAMFAGVVAVGGMNNLDRHWAWDDSSGSNYGSHIDILGPGDLHWSCDATGYTGNYGGTSWATPRVAAIAAMVVNYRNIRGVALRDVMERAADETEYLSVGKFMWHPPYYGLMGSGRANAYEALMAYDKNVSTNWIAASSNNVPYVNCKDMYLDFDVRDSLHGKHSQSLAPNVSTRVRAMVQNRGKQTESFNVTCTVDSAGTRIFQNRQLVTGLASSKAKVVQFDPFRVGADNFNYRINVITDLTGDNNRRNDTFGITARSTRNDTVQYDIGDYDIAYTDPWAAWAVRFVPDRSCTLKAMQFMLYGGGVACTLLVWDETAGKPGSRIGSAQAYTAGAGPSWNTVSLGSPVFIAKPVWVGFKTPGSAPNYVAPCLDRRSDAGMSYYAASGGGSGAGDWGALGEDLLLRPIVAYQGVNTNDVASRVIIAPPGAVVKGVAQLPQATVGNVGSASNSFNVVCRIDSASVNKYLSTKAVGSLSLGDTARVVFDPWIPNWEGGTYNMTIYTDLGTDQNRRNDTLRLNITSNTTAELTAGEGSAAYYFGSSGYFAVKFTPAGACSVMSGRITIYTYGAGSATACTLFVWDDNSGVPGSIVRGPISYSGSPYYPTWNNIAVAPYYTAGPFWLGTFSPGGNPDGKSVMGDNVSPPNNGRSYVSTTRTGPFNLGSHNWLIHANIKYLSTYSNDVGVQSIDAPTAVIKQKTAVTPSATIKNYGNNTQSFNVRCTFDTSGVTVYTSQKTVTSLMPTQTAAVNFDAFSAESLYKYYHQRVTTMLAGDQNPANDSLIDSTYCSDLDIISYSTSPYYYWGDSTYACVRFTPEKPCSVVGSWIALRDGNNQWVNPCSTFLWNRRGNGRTYPGGLVWSERWTPANPGDTAGWFRRTIPATFYDRNQDFWIGGWTPNTGTHQPDFMLDAYLHHERSYYDRNRDSTWWYPLLGDWNIEAIVKYRRMDSPQAPYVFANKTGIGNNAVYSRWQKILQDTLGNPAEVDHYVVYRDTTPRYVPGVGSFLIGQPETTYTDAGAVIQTSDYFYLVKARDVYDQYSKPSNMAYKFRQFLNENASTTDKNWITIPYNSPYDSASRFIDDVDRYICQSITKRDPATQLYKSCYWDDLMGWVDNFAIEKGQMYEVVIGADTAARIVGSHDPDFSVPLNENPSNTDKNWVSIPYNAVYDSASDVIGEVGRYLCQSFTKRDPTTQLYKSCYWDDLMGWVDNFPIVRGMGYEMVVSKDTLWKPRVINNLTGGTFSRGRLVPAVSRSGPTLLKPRFPANELSPVEMHGSGTASAVAATETKRFAGGESHLVRGYLGNTAGGRITMTAYVLNRPDEILTEAAEGCGVTGNGKTALWWCQPGNLFSPWRDREKMLAAFSGEFEAGKAGHRGYFAIAASTLRSTENGTWCGTIALAPIPTPRVTRTDSGNLISWMPVRNGYVLGYLLYRGADGICYPEQVNASVLTTSTYLDLGAPAEAQYALGLVYVGGHESKVLSANCARDMYRLAEETEEVLPTCIDFTGVTPNPFSRAAVLAYQLPVGDRVVIEVFDAAGKAMRSLVRGPKAPGFYRLTWDGRGERGQLLANGVYFVRMETRSFRKTIKVSLVR